MVRPTTRTLLIGNKKYFSARLWPETKVLIDLLISKGEGDSSCQAIHNAVLTLSTKHLEDPEEYVQSALTKLADRYDAMGNFK